MKKLLFILLLFLFKVSTYSQTVLDQYNADRFNSYFFFGVLYNINDTPNPSYRTTSYDMNICMDNYVGYNPLIQIAPYEAIEGNAVWTDNGQSGSLYNGTFSSFTLGGEVRMGYIGSNPPFLAYKTYTGPVTISYDYYLTGANTTIPRTYTKTFPAGAAIDLVHYISPFSVLSTVNKGATQLMIKNFKVARPTDPNPIGLYQIAETLVNLNLKTNLPVPINDVISGANFLADNTNYNLTWNTSLPDGKYRFDISSTGANVSNFFTFIFNNKVDVSGGIATLSIPSTVFPNYGSTTIIINGVYPITNQFVPTPPFGESFQDVEQCLVDYNPDLFKTINRVVALPTGPDITGSKSILISPFCQGTNGSVQFTSSAVADGNYNITYSLSGSNNLASIVVNVNFVSGVSNFIIPSSEVPNSGNTTISILSISDGSGSSTYIPSVDYIFNINPVPKANGTNTIN